MVDPGLQIKGAVIQTLRRGGGGGGGGEGGLQNNFFRPVGLSLVLKTNGLGGPLGPCPGSATGMYSL